MPHFWYDYLWHLITLAKKVEMESFCGYHTARKVIVLGGGNYLIFLNAQWVNYEPTIKCLAISASYLGPGRSKWDTLKVWNHLLWVKLQSFCAHHAGNFLNFSKLTQFLSVAEFEGRGKTDFWVFLSMHYLKSQNWFLIENYKFKPA